MPSNTDESVLDTKSVIDKLTALCIQDPLELIRICMPNVATLAPPPFHRDLANIIIEDEYLNDNVIAPRGHAKTSVTGLGGSLWRTYCVDAFYKRPRRRHFTLLCSRSRGHSINLLTALKNTFEYSEPFKAIFGYHGRMTASKWAEDFVITSFGDVFVAKGMGQQVRGLNVGGLRPDFVLLDDGEDEENTKTAERMEANLRWFLQALCNVAGSNPCKILNIGTPQHQRAIVFTLSEMANWRTHHYSAINVDDDGNEYALWPELRSLQWLQEKRSALEDIGRGSVFQREYMCRVVGDEDQLFREEDVQRVKGEFYRDEHRKGFLKLERDDDPIPVNAFMGVDPASSIRTNADYTGIVVLAIDHDGNRYVLDIIRKRLRPVDVGNLIIALYKKYRPEKTQIESVGYQSMLADYIKREKGMFIPGLNIKNNPRRGKTERLEGLQPIFYQKQNFIVERTKGNEDKIYAANINHFIDELLLFPRSRHDDILDAYYYANKGAYRPYHSVDADTVIKRKKKARRKIIDWEVI